ncbi:2-oxoglutarate dehydrogenase complex dihydrolipoyllysine-residue succinyltransferase [Sneathiella sp. HT1-7]|jgi:2-oxoglutarate dehydrogenase E2 component (dihydrolipoamide succinyltransferase)|uniref:2-oxoglutarate dehydrogenase complex dihydrolipoyllysine-residue succinyltransferase n=1 Tax=Sneathiella sp. HT1-7 TaxID=2887192 RepID=UPI001D147243|nr:2-oxoglutarate dehydrogenase complex dihydrolipoyllysine-residue succinyltransferase [Sneathiella sp. HT1-7]MCC3303630.1 2-oxoglutarate dehydrogenase complex dihydrolipoyllysine-residue succinyltransferase [Sneathiella sp. HT1-7]
MTVEIRVPVLGESVTEATVGQWFKKVGESVAKDEPLLELETDKVTLEVNATEAGRLDEIVVAEGEDVEVGALLGQIAEGAAGSAPEKASEAPKEEAAEKPAAAPAAAPKEEVAPAAASTSATKVEVLPAAQKLIEENNLDAGKLRGTGKDGRITKGDVLEALENGGASPAAPAPATAPAPAPAPAAPSGPRAEEAREERVKMTRLRKSIAARLKDAQNTAAMLTTYNEVDMSGMLDLRAEYKELFLKKHGVKLGFMSFFTKACIAALQETPAVNAEIDGDDLVYKNYYNMGIAVGTDSGLVVPVLRDADKLSFAEVEKGIGALGKKARDGKLSMADLQGGTFTITNGGVYGSLMSSPILNPPQAAVLGMHKIQERPMVIKGEIKIRPMMYLALTYDHRIIDGKEAVTFLVRVKDALEDPQRLLLDL